MVRSFTSLKTLFTNYQLDDRGGYISREFQDYGYRLAMDLDDEKHKSLYIKLAKSKPRVWLEQARTFVLDAQSARSKAKLFMWKLKQIEQSEEAKEPRRKDVRSK